MLPFGSDGLDRSVTATEPAVVSGMGRAFAMAKYVTVCIHNVNTKLGIG